MPKILYREIKFSDASLALIKRCNGIITEYTEQGFRLTLRQLYYQLVSRDVIANKQTEYKRLGSIVNDARLAGLIDWSAIEDRTRNLEKLPSWTDAPEIVSSCASQFHVDMWLGQKYRPEVWIEKDALVGVIERACQDLDVPFLSCRGYTSQSEMWAGAMRLKRTCGAGQLPYIFHLGDHDPSGRDMTRDITDRLEMFMGDTLLLSRLALNMNQVEQFNPPPNPAKVTDSRFQGYMVEFGAESWELDALEPTVIDGLIRNAVNGLINRTKWKARQALKDRGRTMLRNVAENWQFVQDALTEANEE